LCRGRRRSARFVSRRRPSDAGMMMRPAAQCRSAHHSTRERASA
jgi:hypothetical protein